MRVEVGAKSSLLVSCWSILYFTLWFSSPSLPLSSSLPRRWIVRAQARILIPTSPNQLCDLENTTNLSGPVSASARLSEPSEKAVRALKYYRPRAP